MPNANLLVDRFPYMFRGCWPLEMYRGWSPLVVDACQQIDRLLGSDKRRFRWWTVREKHGGLCLGPYLVAPGDDAYVVDYVEGLVANDQEIDQIAATSEECSFCLCICCGSKNASRRFVKGFALTVCAQHLEEWERLASEYSDTHVDRILSMAIEPGYHLHGRPFL